MMKSRNIKTILLLLMMFMFADCEDELDLGPLGELNSNTFYKTEKDFDAASLSTYSTLLNLYFDQNGLGMLRGLELISDDVRNPQGNSSNEEFVWLPNNNDYGYIWQECYKGIMRSNVILNRLPDAPDFADESNKARYEGEARFIRAYFNFLLARNYGTPPVVNEIFTSLEDARLANSAPGEIWDAIIADLNFAKANLPAEWDTDNTGRATSMASYALLGKVYLFRAQWLGNDADYGNALTEFSNVIGNFSLVPDFGDNFREATENNAESIFEIQMTRGDFNPWLAVDFGLNENQNIGAAGTGRRIVTGAACHNSVCAPGANSHGYGTMHVTIPLQAEFEPNDPRRVQTIYLDGDQYTAAGDIFSSQWSITGSTPAKYINPFVPDGFPNNWDGNNERIIRYADVLLMAAEAELLGNGNVGQAVNYINMVRDRARNYYEIVNGVTVPPGTLPAATEGTVDEVMDAIMHERRVELALEVHRYDDLVRWHRAGLINIATDIDFGNTIANNNWSETHLLKPIPQSEIDLNPNLEQNPGY